jgi:hypothetical protein
MNELADEIADAAPLRRIKPFSTPFCLSCLRELCPEDILKSKIAIGVAISEIAGFNELFQMTPVAGNLAWHRALSIGMTARDSEGSQADAPTLGISVLKAILPNIELRSFEDTLEARVQLRNELLAIRYWLSHQAQQGKMGAPQSEISKTARQIAVSVKDLEKRLQAADCRFLKDIARSVITASPPAILSFLIPSIDPAIGKAVAGLIAGWGIWDAIKDRQREMIEESRKAVTLLLKVKRRLG